MFKKDKPEIQQPGSVTWPFRLGDRVRDKINNIEGVAIARLFHLTGCDRFIIELDPKDGSKPEDYIADGGRLELVTSFPERHRNEVPDLHVELGDECRSLINGLTGICAMINVPLFGAVQVDISPKWDPKEKKLPDAYFVDAAFVEVLKPYNARPKEDQKPRPETKKERGAVPMPKTRWPL